MIKVLFMGTEGFSLDIFNALKNDPEYEIIAVLTQPDAIKGRKKVKTPSPIKLAATQSGIPVYQPEKLSKSEELGELINLQPDLIITAAYGQFLPESLLDAARIKAINVHGSLLPKYRGGAPIQYSILNGDEVTGVTIMEMVKQMDAGRMYSSVELPIDPEDDTGSLFDKLSRAGADLLLKTLPEIISGKNEGVAQDETLATFSPNIKPEEEQIKFTDSADNIVNLIRALSPRIGAYTKFNGQRLKIFKAHKSLEKYEANPGEIVELTKDKLVISAGNNEAIIIDEIQPSGKNKMKIKDFLNGQLKNLRIGQKMYE